MWSPRGGRRRFRRGVVTAEFDRIDAVIDRSPSFRWLVVGAFVVASCSGSAESEPTELPPDPVVTDATVSTGTTALTSESTLSPATSTTASTDSVGAPSAADLYSDVLAASGVTVETGDAAGASAFAVPSWQLAALADEATTGGGITGALIDQLAPMPEGFPALSLLIAGWVASFDTPGAAWAADVMGERDWTSAPTMRFPVAVVNLFVRDVLGSADAGTAGGSSEPSGFRRLPEPVPALPPPLPVCPAVEGWATAQMQLIINMAGQLASAGAIPVVNLLLVGVDEILQIDLAFLTTLIETQWPLYGSQVAQAIGVLGTIGFLSSMLTGWTATVTPSAASDRFAVGNEPDRPQTFTASVNASVASWPQILVDCATSIGIALPDPSGAGSTAGWSVSGIPQFGVETARDALFAADGTATLSWTTGREPSDDPPPRVGVVEATVLVDMEARSELVRLWSTAFQVAVSNLLLSSAVLQSGDLLATLDSVMTASVPLSASASVAVTYHPEGCLTGVWRSVDYRAQDQETQVGAGTLTLTFADEANGTARFDPGVPILARLNSPEAPWVRLEFSGGYAFGLSPDGKTWSMSGSDAILNTAADLAGTWVPLEPTPLDDGNGGLSGSDLFTCNGDTLILTVPAAVWEFTRLG